VPNDIDGHFEPGFLADQRIGVVSMKLAGDQMKIRMVPYFHQAAILARCTSLPKLLDADGRRNAGPLDRFGAQEPLPESPREHLLAHALRAME
jgi:hypothetical protein